VFAIAPQTFANGVDSWPFPDGGHFTAKGQARCVQSRSRLTTNPGTDTRNTRCENEEARPAHGPLPAASDPATPESLQEFKARQVERERQVEELGRRMQGIEPPGREARRSHLDAVVQDLRLHGGTDGPKQLACLTEIVEQAVRRLPAAVRREVTIRMENAGAPDVIVSLEEVVWVVTNLLVHAARATGPGKPIVVVSRIAPGNAGMARLEIIAGGAGPTFRLELPAATAV
jgi:hypothetical protein